MLGVSFLEASKIGGGGQITEGGVRADGVVDFFPLAEFLIEFRDGLGFFFEEMIELIVVGFVASFEEAVVFGRMGVGEEVGCGFSASFFEEAEELGAVVGIEVLEGEREGVSDLGQEAFRGLGRVGGVGAEHADPGAGIDGGELVDFGAVGEAEMLGIELEERAGSGLVKGLGGTQTGSVEAAQVFLPGFREEEVVAANDASEGGGGEGEAVALVEEDGELVFGPGGELFTEGDDLVHGSLGKWGGAQVLGPSGAVFEGSEVAGVEAVEPEVEGGGGEGEVPAGETGVAVMGVIEVDPGEAALGLGGKVEVAGQVVESALKAKDTHGNLLVETPSKITANAG